MTEPIVAPRVRKTWQRVDGVLLLDKPAGLTSNTALQKARRLFSAAKAGHTGTLDPMATGLLPVLFGEATKFSHALLEADKTYTATLKLGQTTTTGDAEGELLETLPVTCHEAAVLAACQAFVGPQNQVPPMYSALKFQGKALYDYARQGIEIERQARAVVIHHLTVLDVRLPEVEISVCCSKGTYIRTLAEDIGKALGCGAHLTALRRTATGPLALTQAWTLTALEETAEAERAPLLAAVDSLLLHLPALQLDATQLVRFEHGNAVSVQAVNVGQVRVYGESFLGLGEVRADGLLHAIRLISTQDV